MMEKIKNYIIIILLIIISFLVYLNINIDDIRDKEFVIEEKVGEVSKELSEVIPDTVYIKVSTNKGSEKQLKKVIVDSIYKEEYEKAIKDNDSLKAKNLFLESISLNNWKGVLVDNKDITINGEFLTRGKLLNYNLDYKIKSDTITFKPVVKYIHPKLTLLPGIKFSLPTDPINNTQPLVEVNLGIQGKKGNITTFGIDSEKRLIVGYNFSLVIFK